MPSHVLDLFRAELPVGCHAQVVTVMENGQGLEAVGTVSDCSLCLPDAATEINARRRSTLWEKLPRAVVAEGLTSAGVTF